MIAYSKNNENDNVISATITDTMHLLNNKMNTVSDIVMLYGTRARLGIDWAGIEAEEKPTDSSIYIIELRLKISVIISAIVTVKMILVNVNCFCPCLAVVIMDRVPE